MDDCGYSSSYMKLVEANYLVRHGGLSIDEACQLVEMPSERYFHVSERNLSYTPTPEQIRESIAEIRSGKVKLKGTKRRRRQQEQRFRAWNEDYDLAGDIDEDRLTMPDWFRG